MHQLPNLPYGFADFEPKIDAQTMELHYSKHHQGYVSKLNEALAGHSALLDLPIEDLLKDLSMVPEEIRTAVSNFGGGHYNHTLFWANLTPEENQPDSALRELIDLNFGSWDKFQEEFLKAANGVFGSGWVWLVKDEANKVRVITTKNQDNPISENHTPLLGIDVWEHAYYLNYQNRRADYLAAIWSLINWSVVEKRFYGKESGRDSED